MKIVILNGSPRKNGATATVLRLLSDALSLHEDISILYIHLVDLKIAPCVGCCACYQTGACFMGDDAEQLSQSIASADGIILGSPTYASNVSGILKTFIDRGHFVIEQLLYKKYALSVSTYENYGGHTTSKILNSLLTYSGARLSGSMKIKLPFGAAAQQNAKLQLIAKTYASKLYQDITHHKKYRLQQLRHRIIFSAGIKPFVLRKGNAYSGVLRHWADRGVM